GPLARLANPPENLLVLNGDILTDLDFSQIVQTHRKAQAAATIMTIAQKVPIDYGVLTTNDRGHVISYDEKPQLTTEVSGGVYVFSRRALKCIPKGERFDFPDLVQVLLDRGEVVATHRHETHWLDIGRRDDYQLAADLVDEKPEVFLPPMPQGATPTVTEVSQTGSGIPTG
ncbi:MAG: hypothetical protein GY869_31805, partial [Planctomycetes bacterium]|nr:hypothetical protein [Planctomycetota bacterium]